MLGVHTRLHVLQAQRERVVVPSRQGLPVYKFADLGVDPLDAVADEVAAGAAVLALDELHVTDVADAMILSRLFRRLVAAGCLVLFTSNSPPDALYAGGLSYKFFRPFVDLINRGMLVLRVAGPLDYRSLQARRLGADGASAAGGALQTPDLLRVLADGWRRVGDSAASAHVPPGLFLYGSRARDLAGSLWRAVTEGQAVSETWLPAEYGRQVWLPIHTHAWLGPPAASPLPAALLDFEGLVGQQGLRRGVDQGGALAAPDMLALCRALRLLVIVGVRPLGLPERDAARRLITLIDVAYDEGGCQLVLAGTCGPQDLFLTLLQAAQHQGLDASQGRTTPLDVAWVGTGGPITSTARVRRVGEEEKEGVTLTAEEVLMIHRATSRLTEMTASLHVGPGTDFNSLSSKASS